MRFSPANHYPFHEGLNILCRSLSSDTYIFHLSFRVRDQSTPIQYNRSVKLDFMNEIVKQTEW
jgi:methylphosphotriester-DNA--protein-cysteine methyltransferase